MGDSTPAIAADSSPPPSSSVSRPRSSTSSCSSSSSPSSCPPRPPPPPTQPRGRSWPGSGWISWRRTWMTRRPGYSTGPRPYQHLPPPPPLSPPPFSSSSPSASSSSVPPASAEPSPPSRPSPPPPSSSPQSSSAHQSLPQARPRGENHHSKHWAGSAHSGAYHLQMTGNLSSSASSICPWRAPAAECVYAGCGVTARRLCRAPAGRQRAARSSHLRTYQMRTVMRRARAEEVPVHA